MQKRRQHANHLQNILRLAEEERLHDNAVESEPSMSATPSPSLPLPPPLPLPMPPSPHRTVRRLTMENLPPLARIPAARSQSPERIASPVAKEMPTSPNVHCSQYRMYTMEQYERQNGPLPWHCKVGSWLRYVHAAYEPDGPSSYPTPPTAPWKDRYVSESESELAVRAGAAGYAYQERRALCAQLLLGPAPAVLLCHRTPRGRPHNGHTCFYMRDILWARL